MKFSNFNFVFALWILPVLLILLILFERKRKQTLNNMFSRRLAKIMIKPQPEKQKFHYLFFFLSAALFIFALMGPRWGYHYEEISLKGSDIVIALDVSNSMLATDIKPSRLKRAKMEIKNMLKNMKGDRVGLVLFAGDAVIACPLTVDYDAFQLFLDNANPDSISLQGTNLYSAVKKAMGMIKRSKQGSSAIILITDGEDHSGKFAESIEEAGKEKVLIYSSGIGTPEGSPIPLGGGGFLKDKKGNLVVSRLDEESLKEAAVKTGGAYFRIGAGDMDLETLYTREIRPSLTGVKTGEKRRKIWEERFQIPLFAGIVMLCLFVFWEEKKG